MMRRMVLRSSSIATATLNTPDKILLPVHGELFLSHNPQIQMLRRHFLDIHKIINKEAIEKERARLSDELNRGYFADISEFKKHGGKIAMATETLIPSTAAVKFPDLDVYFSDGRSLKLPVSSEQSETDTCDKAIPCVSLVCLSFRASSQTMTESWAAPFLEAFRSLDAFGPSGKIQIYEVSFIDSWFLSLGLLRRLVLKMMNKSSSHKRQIVYSFGDHYYFRKKLQILNLLTGYFFLLDRFGRIRWQGYGSSSKEEYDSLLSCTRLLLDEK